LLPEKRRWFGWLVSAALALFLVVAVVVAPDAGEDRARAIGSQIRCPVCQGESIADSPSQSARDLMDLVRQRIDEGLTDQQIIDELISSYSGALLLDPPLRGATLWLWLAPIAALGIGAALISRRFRASPGEGDRIDLAPTSDLAPPKRRALIGGVVLTLAAAVAVAAVGQFRQARGEDGLFSGVAGGSIDPDAISNETMEAVIASNLGNPEISGMRLALANRYFEEGDYQKAFPHYQAVIEDAPTDSQAAAAYTRLGWMVYDGNGEVDLALSLIDQALGVVPDDAFATYLKGRVVWCGREDPAGAAELFSQVLIGSGLDDQVRSRVEADLTAVEAGARCP
jgi:cytochrome c-type biogenesis protein CcmH